jgi:hypothetical protein
MLNSVTRILTCPFKLHFGILLHIHGLAADKYKFFEKMERHDAADKKQRGHTGKDEKITVALVVSAILRAANPFLLGRRKPTSL